MNPYALWALAPQASASANFATSARGELYKYTKEGKLTGPWEGLQLGAVGSLIRRTGLRMICASCCHLLSHALLRVGTPVFAVQANEH